MKRPRIAGMSAGRGLLLLCLLTGILSFSVRPHAQGPAVSFHVVGDLPDGAEFSGVRDVTRVNGVIYATGTTVTRFTCPQPGCLPPGGDTVFLWRFDGTSATMQALPDIDPFPLATNGPNGGWDITPDARFIASQARKSNSPAAGFSMRAVRLDTSLLPGAAANVNLNATFSPALTTATAAVTMSDDGTILYGSAGNRAVRYDITGATSGFIPLLVRNGATDTQNSVALRGASADGRVVVGTSVNSAGNPRAYRYDQNAGVTAIPLLPGGQFNNAMAVSRDGDLVLVSGHNPDHGTVEVYLYRASTGVVQQLGSPNSNPTWGPGVRVCIPGVCNPGRGLLAGMTDDGAVVAVGFLGPDGQNAYLHNAHGWFHLESALLAGGYDVVAAGFDANTLAISGMSPDGTLVFGGGAQNGIVKGFVADFPAGFLAAFNPQPVPPTNRSIVGAWRCDEPGTPACALVFTAGGAYYHIEGSASNPLNGFEWGFYYFNGAQLSFLTRVDTNGSTGASGGNGTVFPATVIGDALVFADVDGVRRIGGSPGSLNGGWVSSDPPAPDDSYALVADGDTYFFAADGPDQDDSDAGTFTWDPVTHELVSTTFGQGPDGGNFVTLSADGLSLHVADEGSSGDFARVIDPATIPVIANTPLSASGVVGQAFSYGVGATNTVAFGATGLPSGLSVNSTNGTIDGTPAVGGQFSVTITAANAVGVSDIETLVLTIAIPTPVGQNVVVQPEVPQGQGPVTMSFGEITSAGTTTVTVVDQSSVPPPGNVAVGGVIYEVTTTATYQGLIQLCFSYAGIDFGAATPRLFHYENNEWVDITTSVDPGTQTICGATTSLSPFAVLVSNVVRTGFYAPVNPVAGFLNTAKGGATVPLKFNVAVNGVNQTTTTGLTVTTQTISCEANAPEDPVEPAAITGGTSLRYDAAAGHFVQNWKVPATPGRCYMVRMATAQDGLALTARFKVK